MRTFFTALFTFAVIASSSATDLKQIIKLEFPKEITAGAPMVIKLSNIPKGYKFHGYLFYAAHVSVPAGLDKGAEVYTRKNKIPKWNVYIFGSALADRMTYIKARDMWKRNFDLTFKTANWPAGKYQAGINLSFIDSKRKAFLIKLPVIFTVIPAKAAAK